MRILALSPHTDDAELAAGASIHKWVEQGHIVTIAAFSTGDENTGASVEEARAAAAVLGVRFVPLYDYTGYLYPAHRLPEFRQSIIEDMIRLRQECQPDLVLCPSTWDCHQDHHTVNQEAIRAFRRDSCILGYDQPANNVVGNVGLTYYSRVSDIDLLAKLNAVACYVSQKIRPTSDERIIGALALLRGLQCNTTYAEAFEVIRWIEK